MSAWRKYPTMSYRAELPFLIGSLIMYGIFSRMHVKNMETNPNFGPTLKKH